MSIRLEWKPQDLWIGVYWRVCKLGYLLGEPLCTNHYDVWICLLPCLPIHISWQRKYLPK